jgi:small subunit ribosomal protein S13
MVARPYGFKIGSNERPIPGVFDKKTGEKMKDAKDSKEKKEFRKPQSEPAQPHEKPSPAADAASGKKEFRGIVRIAGKDLKGEIPLRRAIPAVRGIGANLGQILSAAIAKELGVDEEAPVGELSEEQLKHVEEFVSSAGAHGIPSFMLNRQKDSLTGQTRHLIGTDLVFATRQDIEREKNIYTWRGYRHAYGQKVRGQHTRSTGRTGMTVGVLRKAVLAKAGTAAAAQTGAAAQAAGAAPAAGAAGAKGTAGPAPKAAAGPAAKAAAPAAKAAAPAAAGKKETPKKA